MAALYAQIGKRIIDLAIIILFAIISSPLFLAVSLAIKIEDGGPIIFRQTRIGMGGLGFTIHKFRTMPSNTPNLESRFAESLNVTRVGKLLRRLSLDELPQVIDVLCGTMSIVGPRPPLPSQHQVIEGRRKNGSLSLKPGVTGWAQVKGRDGMTDDEKVALDGIYAKRMSLWFDIKIIFLTIGYVLRKPPTY